MGSLQKSANSLGSAAVAQKKPFEEMVGEGFRDIGILIFVFSILDTVVTGHITTWWTLAAVAISAFFFLAGCYIERRRPDG